MKEYQFLDVRASILVQETLNVVHVVHVLVRYTNCQVAADA